MNPLLGGAAQFWVAAVFACAAFGQGVCGGVAVDVLLGGDAVTEIVRFGVPPRFVRLVKVGWNPLASEEVVDPAPFW